MAGFTAKQVVTARAAPGGLVLPWVIRAGGQ